MTKLLEEAIAAVRELPPEMQDYVAGAILALTRQDDEDVHILTPEEIEAIDESEAQAARREFATDEQVQAVWAKYGL